MQVEIIEQRVNGMNRVEDFLSFENRINNAVIMTEVECEREIIDVVFLVKDNRMYAIIKSK
jgi:hypothetical protein